MTHQSRLDEERWKEYVKDLQEFKEKFGHAKVPQKYPKLGQWVHHVRCAQKALQQGKPYSLKLTPNRISELEAIGFVWGESRPGWNEHVKDLQHFRQQHGHTLVPANFPENTGLSKWVRRVRVAYSLIQQGKFKKGATIKLTEERIHQLKAVGFVWNTKNKQGSIGTAAIVAGAHNTADTADTDAVVAYGADGTGIINHSHDNDDDGMPEPYHPQPPGQQHEQTTTTTAGGDTITHRISQGYRGAKRRRTSEQQAHNVPKLCPEGVRIQEQLKLSQERLGQLEEQTRDLEHKLKEQQEVAEFRRIQNEGLWDENEKLQREIADLKAGRLVFQHWNR